MVHFVAERVTRRRDAFPRRRNLAPHVGPGDGAPGAGAGGIELEPIRLVPTDLLLPSGLRLRLHTTLGGHLATGGRCEERECAARAMCMCADASNDFACPVAELGCA